MDPITQSPYLFVEYNNKKFDVQDLPQIPHFFYKTIENTSRNEMIPLDSTFEPFKLPPILRGRVDTLKSVVTRLNEKNSTFNKERIFSLLKAALHVALVATLISGGFLVSVCPPVGLVITLVSATALMVYEIITSRDFRDEITINSSLLRVALGFFWTVAAPGAIIYQGFVHEKNKIQELDLQAQKLNKKFQDNLPVIFDFFKYKFPVIKDEINRQIEKAKADLNVIDTIETEKERCQETIAKKLELLQQGLETLNHAETKYTVMKEKWGIESQEPAAT